MARWSKTKEQKILEKSQEERKKACLVMKKIPHRNGNNQKWNPLQGHSWPRGPILKFLAGSMENASTANDGSENCQSWNLPVGYWKTLALDNASIGK